jgi:hypothetical protein
LENSFGSNSGVIANTVHGGIHLNMENRKRIPSLLPKFIEVLTKLYPNSTLKDAEIPNTQPYTIEEKIDHNDVILYRETIEEYYIYYPICESSFESLRHIDENSKRKILTDIHEIYREIKLDYMNQCNEFENPLEELKKLIKKNADNIIKMVQDKIKDRIIKSYDGEEFTEQDLTICLNIFVCYALGECKILERPEKKR